MSALDMFSSAITNPIDVPPLPPCPKVLKFVSNSKLMDLPQDPSSIASVLREGIYATIRLGTYEAHKDLLYELSNGALTREGIPLKALSGLMSGAIGATIANPADLIKIRMQAHHNPPVPEYASITSSLRCVYNEGGGTLFGGLRALWRGTSATVTRGAIVTVAQIGSYDHFKQVIKSHRLMDEGIPLHLTSSLLAGLVCSIASNPVVTQHLSNTALFLSTFARLKTGRLDPRVLVYLGSGLSILGFGIYEIGSPRWAYHRLAQALKSSILVFLALASLAPVLRTLTAATSDNSIWALAAGLFILHTVLADYTPERVRVVHDRVGGEGQGGLTAVLSINAAVSASVVLASRLQTDNAVFSLMLFAVQSFALLPVLRQRLQRYPVLSLTLTCFVTGLSLAALPSPTLVLPLSTLLALVTFGSPAVLVWSQRYKNRIRGPWDPAIPQLNSKKD
ncbi:Phosphatidylinositol N-acetylglucosaminyltransferase GPI2 subunit [Schizosaccharomyces pombe 972h-] [Rhizoctonia solani]|uniref:Phosphatidylinositol N-acetylglucosaminyltransferase GPI2 subunit [Schizosaccharomyces pombe 972h-] n=1 Tax=Rhizoctonia solani TaxID=456999 RepID=A0A0K6GBV8_9AGAM|nr:Phosphatidylinositol N-acetylglucosaminyltransferase GPI2 subunit [Schizosaccharomyces pombe 972h-] [Rhizoctonia solani]